MTFISLRPWPFWSTRLSHYYSRLRRHKLPLERSLSNWRTEENSVPNPSPVLSFSIGRTQSYVNKWEFGSYLPLNSTIGESSSSQCHLLRYPYFYNDLRRWWLFDCNFILSLLTKLYNISAASWWNTSLVKSPPSRLWASTISFSRGSSCLWEISSWIFLALKRWKWINVD